MICPICGRVYPHVCPSFGYSICARASWAETLDINSLDSNEARPQPDADFARDAKEERDGDPYR